jgi:hypothetical protein
MDSMTVIEQLIKQLKKKSASTDYGRGDALPGSLGALRSNRAGWVGGVDLFQLLDRDLAGQRGTAGQKGTGQIRRRVKEDENGIGIAGARSFSSNAGGGGGVANK